MQEATQAIHDKVKFPDGYYFEFGGQFKNLQEAKARLMIVVPLAPDDIVDHAVCPLPRFVSTWPAVPDVDGAGTYAPPVLPEAGLTQVVPPPGPRLARI